MKILDLLEAIVNPAQATKQFSGKLKRREWGGGSGRKELGMGGYASVKPHPTDDFLVKKHHTGPDAAADDGYNAYIKYVIDNDLMDNPHFPRVYNITKIKDKAGKFIYTYDVEKLNDLNSMTREDYEAIINTHFNSNAMHFADFDSDSVWENAMRMAKVVRSGIQSDTPSYFTGSFRDAVKKIIADRYNIRRENGSAVGLDVHAGNIMFRRTPHGPQLVLTDIFE